MKIDYIPKQIPVGKAKNITNQRFGKLIALYRVKNTTVDKHTLWYCKCDCGNFTLVQSRNLINHKTQSCGCWNKERDRSYAHGPQIDMTDQVVNGFKVLKQDLSYKSGKNKSKHWFVECPFCNRIFSIDGRNLRYGKQKSCGCIKSIGEYKITQLLLKNNINFKTQYIFQDLPKRKFDFAIFNNDNKLKFLIEFDGQQHFNKNSKYYSEEGIQRDKEKNLYCLKNNIKLYRIPYTERDNLTFEKLTQSSFLVKGD